MVMEPSRTDAPTQQPEGDLLSLEREQEEDALILAQFDALMVRVDAAMAVEKARLDRLLERVQERLPR